MDALKTAEITANTWVSPAPVVLELDTDGHIKHINVSGCELYGCGRSDLIGADWFKHCLPRTQRAGARNIFTQLITTASDGASHYLCPALTRTGESQLLSWYLEAHTDNDGTVAGVLVTGVQIADNVADTSFLLQSAARNQAVLDNAIEAIISADTNGVITHANRTCESVFGYRDHELVGNNISCLMPTPHHDHHKDYIREYLDTGNKNVIGVGLEVTALRKDGSKVPIELTVTEIRVDGKLSFTAIMRDISERKIAEQRLKRSEEETRQARDRLALMDRLHIASEMSTGIAHELNQPLAAISMYAQACRNRIGNGDLDPKALTQILTKIENQALRAGDVIHHLRSLIGKQKSCRELTDINRLIQDTVDLAQVDSEARQVSINCCLAANLPILNVVRTQIQQVLLNLIRNACDAIQDTTTSERLLTISSTAADNAQVMIAVRDCGPGVDKSLLDHIFQPFFSSKKSGMGMGLAISHTIIKNHGGSLRLNRDYHDGAEFSFTLPVRSKVRD